MHRLQELLRQATEKQNEIWSHQIIRSREDLNDWLKTEKQKYSQKMSGGIVCLTENDYIWRYQKRLRKTEYYSNTNKLLRYFFSRVRLIRLSAKLGMNVRLNSCGKGLRIVHISSVITSGDIGENYTAFPNTLVGQGTDGRNPVIGDNVSVFAGAIIVGGVTIANDVIVGANSFVNKSFLEEGVIIAGVPARIIKHRSTSDR